MSVPTVHRNGTDKRTLSEGYQKAFAAVSAALDELCLEASPNARDYYVQGDDAFMRAAAEHQARVKALIQIKEELHAIHINIAEQGK